MTRFYRLSAVSHKSNKNSIRCPPNFITFRKSAHRGLTTALPGFILRSSSKQKPMTQTSRQNEFLPASRRQCKGGRNDSVEWTAEGGPNRSPLGAPAKSNDFVGRGEKNGTERNFRRQAEMKWWRFFRRSKLRRAFPPLPRKGMCWHTAERAISDRQFGWHRRSFKTFVPKEPVSGPFRGIEVFF